MVKTIEVNKKSKNQPPKITRARIKDLVRCKNDPVYFIESYCKAESYGKIIPIKLLPEQRKMVEAYHSNAHVIVNGARRTGKTLVTTLFLLWYSIFNSDKVVIIGSPSSIMSKTNAFIILTAYEHLPTWLKPNLVECTSQKIRFDNKSSIYIGALAPGSGYGKGFSLDKVFFDEFALVPQQTQKDIWQSLIPCLATGDGMIIASSPSPNDKGFNELYTDASTGANGFHALEVTETYSEDFYG